jgi:hypothetical protein
MMDDEKRVTDRIVRQVLGREVLEEMAYVDLDEPESARLTTRGFLVAKLAALLDDDPYEEGRFKERMLEALEALLRHEHPGVVLAALDVGKDILDLRPRPVPQVYLVNPTTESD